MSYFLSIIAIQPPFDTGKDEFHRAVYSCNYRCQVRDLGQLGEEIAEYIVNELADLPSFEYGVNLFTGSTRSLSENSETLIIESGGFESIIPHSKTNIINRPTFQVLCFDINPDIASDKAWKIYRLLDGTFNVEL